MSPNALPRRLSVGVLSTGLLAGVLIPLTQASAAGCASWTDKKGDATTDQSGVALLADAQLDIVAAALGTVGDSLVATITTDGLGGSSSDAGDEFVMMFTVGTVTMTMYADRVAAGGATVDSDAGIFDNQGSATPLKRGEATYDVKTKTVTIKIKTADVVAASGGKVTVGSTLTGLVAQTTNVVPVVYEPLTPYDDAPTTLTTVLGRACELGGVAAAPAPAGPASGSSPAPSGSPSAKPTSSASAAPTSSASPSASASASASASPSPAPAPQPTVPVPATGCFGFEDPKGDARPGGQAPNDPDLDILSVTGRTTPTSLSGHLRIDKLAAKPALPVFSGHRFEYQFTIDDKVVLLRANAEGEGAGLVGGVAAPDLKVTAAFDTVSSQVVLSVTRESLETVLDREVPEGTFLSSQVARSIARNASPVPSPADTATTEDASRARYTVGDNTCFAPKISVSLPGQVQTSDSALISVSITTSDGRVAAGQRVTARVGGSRAVSARTDSQGNATLVAPVTDAAGSRLLVVRSSGSTGPGELTSPVRVVTERALLFLGADGAGAARTVTATLTDDDEPRRGLAGQRVVFTFGGRSVAATTDSAGRASTQVPAGTVVDAAFAGRTGFLTEARARARA